MEKTLIMDIFLHVKKVEYLDDYEVRIIFNDGTVKEVDLKKELYGEMFEPLKDLNLFKKVKVNKDTNTIEWENGADFAPEFLYEIGKTIKKAA